MTIAANMHFPQIYFFQLQRKVMKIARITEHDSNPQLRLSTLSTIFKLFYDVVNR